VTHFISWILPRSQFEVQFQIYLCLILVEKKNRNNSNIIIVKKVSHFKVKMDEPVEEKNQKNAAKEVK